MGGASYAIGVSIHRDGFLRTLGLSHKTYIEKSVEKI